MGLCLVCWGCAFYFDFGFPNSYPTQFISPNPFPPPGLTEGDTRPPGRLGICISYGLAICFWFCIVCVCTYFTNYACTEGFLLGPYVIDSYCRIAERQPRYLSLLPQEPRYLAFQDCPSSDYVPSTKPRGPRYLDILHHDRPSPAYVPEHQASKPRVPRSPASRLPIFSLST